MESHYTNGEEMPLAALHLSPRPFSRPAALTESARPNGIGDSGPNLPLAPGLALAEGQVAAPPGIPPVALTAVTAAVRPLRPRFEPMGPIPTTRATDTPIAARLEGGRGQPRRFPSPAAHFPCLPQQVDFFRQLLFTNPVDPNGGFPAGGKRTVCV